MFPRLKGVDPATLTQAFAVVGAIVLTVEGLLGYWIYRSEGTFERAICGLVMVLLFGMILVVVLLRREDSDGARQALSATARGATAEEIRAATPEQVGGSDGMYVINKPPEPWIMREQHFLEYMRDYA